MGSAGKQETGQERPTVETVGATPRAPELTGAMSVVRREIGLEELRQHPLRRVRTEIDTGLSTDDHYFAVPIAGSASFDLYDAQGNLARLLVREQNLAPTLDQLKQYPAIKLTTASAITGIGEGPFYPYPCADAPGGVDLYDMSGKLVSMYVSKLDLV